ncbi:hypothetical protein [Ornithinibacillus contaminans]|uniref:hypothetical protein n=1 Tax=Ornithinibacillus contaminans TaxID=694055 RepID=UPI00064D7456|nr:hypothetical protein [Ornithinibacillus contaminans]
MLLILNKVSEAIENIKEKLIDKKAYKIASDPIKRETFKTNYQVEFDDFIKEWIVVASYCVNCDIQIIELVADNEIDAYFIAIKNTINGRKPSLNEKCSNCISEINSLKKELLDKDNKIKAYQLALVPSEREKVEKNFDVFFDKDDKRWKVVTGYCQMGGCENKFYVAESEIDAYREAFERTLKNQRPVSDSACSECYNSFYADY